MKIIFICGCLEQGKDGVGDYTRKLCSELTSKGHQCSIIALMDRYIEKDLYEFQIDEDVSINVLRLPFQRGYKNNSIIAAKWLKVQNPDWVSLQFVAFAFNNKGLPFGLSTHIKKIAGTHKFHIMLHELWVGINRESSYKIRFWGGIQRKLLKCFLKKLSPNLINTHTDLYQYLLNKMGFKTEILPLFSNIRFYESPIEINLQKQNLNIIIFGNIHHGAPIGLFARELGQIRQIIDKKIVIIFVGKCGIEQFFWEEELKLNGIEVENMGEQPAHIISNLMQQASLGLTSTPLLLLQKSGTVAAMREHGLSVMCLARKWSVKGFNPEMNQIGIYEYKEGNAYEILSKNLRIGLNSSAKSEVSNRFITSLIND